MSEPIRKTIIFYKIIHICSEINNFCYVGHTCNVKSRKSQHKSDCNNPDSPNHNNKLYQVIRTNGGFKNFKMVILGTRENLTKTDAHIIEEEYRKSENANLNTYRCHLTPEERAEQIKNWREENPDYFKNWREENPDYFKNWCEKNSDYHKNWREENPDYFKNWCEKNPDYHKNWREAKKQAAKNI